MNLRIQTPAAKAERVGSVSIELPGELTAASVLAIVGCIVILLYFFQLGQAPFVDPPEGLHANIAQEMNAKGDWLTPHMNGVRYFDKPPLLYWLMGGSFGLMGTSEWAARGWSALFAVATALLTAWLGMRIGSKRLGLIAGLIVAVNFEFFVFGRLVKQDILFIFFILLSFAFFIVYYQDGIRTALIGCYASLGATVLAKDILGVIGPVVVFILFLVLIRERNLSARWLSWAGLAAFAVIAFPWYLLMELKNPGFLWYTVVDKHVLNFFYHRVFPDEDIPLTSLEFLAVTAVGFLPWSLMLPFALTSAFSRPLGTKEANIWFLLALWVGAVLLLFTISEFKLPHYGLPAFPAMALLVAKVWDDALARKPAASSVHSLLAPGLAIVGMVGAVFFLGWQGMLDGAQAALLPVADVTTRNLADQGIEAPLIPSHLLKPYLAVAAMSCWFGCIGLAVAMKQRHAGAGLGVLFGVTAMLLLVTADGFVHFAKGRASTAAVAAMKDKLMPKDLVIHEGPLENSGSLVLALNRQVAIVNGHRSNLAFGSTFPEAKHVFWSEEKLKQAWTGSDRIFLVSVINPGKSVVNMLPTEHVHFIETSGRTRLYSNRP